MAVTVDASVFVSAFSPTEPESDKSLGFLVRLREGNDPLILPVLVLPEVVAAVARKQGNPELALELGQDLKNFPNLTLVAVDESLATVAVEAAARYKLRGSDAVYAAVALRYGTELVTLDREQLERLPAALTVREP
jgi:predicted nucleic acid-binding protein